MPIHSAAELAARSWSASSSERRRTRTITFRCIDTGSFTVEMIPVGPEPRVRGAHQEVGLQLHGDRPRERCACPRLHCAE